MNKRRKKKQYKKIVGRNPPKWLLYKAPVYYQITRIHPGKRKKQEERKKGQQDNLPVFIRAMTERRRKRWR